MARLLIVLALGMSGLPAGQAAGADLTQWSIGNPTDGEQYYLELINRARANPTAEGDLLANTTDPAVTTAYSYFGVNLAMMKSELTLLTVAPPLAMNAKLIQSARGHSDYMFNSGTQDHTGSNGSTIADRITAAGYSWSNLGENIFAASNSPWHGHASFEVDWGPGGAGGMQAGRVHRSIMHGGYREIGIGIREGVKMVGSTPFGPQVVTQDFAIPAGPATPFVTGVAYYDLNGNGGYDPGEGIGGVTVNVTGSSYYGVTAPSGGYAVPVPAGAASRTVDFSGLGFSHSTTAAIGSSNKNVKVDLKPGYVPPLISGPPGVYIAISNICAISGVNGATGYDCRVMRKSPAVTDTANDLTRVNTVTSGYSPLSTAVKQEGTGSYHLLQPAFKNETITYKASFVGGTAPSISFRSRLAHATVQQKAFVQVSTDAGISWITVDTQTGSGGSGQNNFGSSPRVISLPSMAGREFLLRFNFTTVGTSAYQQVAENFGWYIDSVTFTDILDTGGGVITPVSAGNTFPFVPAAAGQWLLSARPLISGRAWAFGPNSEVNVLTGPPPPAFATWAAGFEASAGLLPGTLLAAPTADYNKDGVANLVAYALGLSPVLPSAALLPRPEMAQGSLRLDYPVDAAKTDIAITPQVSRDLRAWFSPGQPGAPVEFSDAMVSGTGSIQTRRASIRISVSTPYYLRLQVNKL